MQDHPPILAIIDRETSKPPYRNLFLARYHQQQWVTKKLFTIGITTFDSRLSPDKRWYYHASVNNGTFLGKVGQPKLKKISEELLNCRFSPDSRYLLGTEHFRGGIVIFDLTRDARMIAIEKPSPDWTSHESGLPLGWYPDGRAFWYCASCEEDGKDYFRVFVGSWRRERLSAREAKQIPLDWDLSDPRFWYAMPAPKQRTSETAPKGYYVFWSWYACSWNRQFRLRVTTFRKELKEEPFFPEEPSFGQLRYEVSLEARKGHSQVLASLDDRETGWIRPGGVSNDGKCVFWSAEPPLNDPVRQTEGILKRTVLMNVDTREQQFLPDEVPRIGRRPSYLWFDER